MTFGLGTWPIPPYRCPYCGHYQDSTATDETDRPPLPGDVSICIECYGLAIRDTLGQPRRVTMDDLHPDTAKSVQRLVAMLRLVKGDEES